MASRTRPTEFNKVEKPLMEQLAAMEWEVQIEEPGSDNHISVPEFTYRDSFHEVLLKKHLKAAILDINRTEDGDIWLDEDRVNQAVTALDRVGASRLLEANVNATKLLLNGVTVDGDPDLHGTRSVTLNYIDFDNVENNTFLAINQFRVDPLGRTSTEKFRIPDIVLFVNGIPLVVIEAKAPAITTPMEKAIKQLLLYSNQREDVEEDEGVERLFWYNQALIATYYFKARVSTIGATYEHYVEWKQTTPKSEDFVLNELSTSRLVSQHTLVAGMLRPANLLDIFRNFTLFKTVNSRQIKIIPRYQQFTAVYEAIRRLKEEDTRLQDGEFDRRGGIVWHTQGSGKSLTMVFLVRKLRTMPELRRFKIVVVTDRRDLEDQLSETMQLTGETVQRARNSARLRRLLASDTPEIVFGMIQKYRREEPDDEDESNDPLERHIEAIDRYPALNDSEDILVLVDEAHRSHTDEWHANLLSALPNCARIGFTGTPIFTSGKKKTEEIFGDFIDVYTIRQSEEDGATVPIIYEGRNIEADVFDRNDLDKLFESEFEELSPEERQRIREKYAQEKDVLEAIELIEAKARDVLAHYVANILPNGFKAQLVAVSRKAAIRFQGALVKAQRDLINALERNDETLLNIPQTQLATYGGVEIFMENAHRHLGTIRRLEFAAVISADQHDPSEYRQWSNRSAIDERIHRFKQPLVDEDNPNRQDGLSFLCVRTMLLTGFDAPIEQVLYLDRFIQGHELLQAIARVNRTLSGKDAGYVVDYYGVTHHLKKALAVYSREDVDKITGALHSIKDILPILKERHEKLFLFFREHSITDIYDEMDECVFLLEDERLRAEYVILLREFLTSMDIVLPRPEALPYSDDARQFSVIHRTVKNLYRDEELSIAGLGNKVGQLIDDHIKAYDIRLTVPPISIMDADFDVELETYTNNRTKAIEMEHAARYEIRVNLEMDPVFYEKMSERLESILERFEDNWDALVEALREYIDDLKAGRQKDERTNLDPRKQSPFMSILVDELGADESKLSDERLRQLAQITVELVEFIQREIRQTAFWQTPTLRESLEGNIFTKLDEYDIFEFDRLESIASRIVDLAKRRHVELVRD